MKQNLDIIKCKKYNLIHRIQTYFFHCIYYKVIVVKKIITDNYNTMILIKYANHVK